MNILGKLGSVDLFSSNLTSYKASSANSSRFSEFLHEVSFPAAKSVDKSAEALHMGPVSSPLGLNYFGLKSTRRRFNTNLVRIPCHQEIIPSVIHTSNYRESQSCSARKGFYPRLCDFIMQHAEILGFVKAVERPAEQSVKSICSDSVVTSMSDAHQKMFPCETVDECPPRAGAGLRVVASVCSQAVSTSDACVSINEQSGGTSALSQSDDSVKRHTVPCRTSSNPPNIIEAHIVNSRTCKKKKKMSKDKRLRRKKQQGLLPACPAMTSQQQHVTSSPSMTFVLDVNKLSCTSTTPVCPSIKITHHGENQPSTMFTSGADPDENQSEFSDDSDFEDTDSVDLDTDLWESLSQCALTSHHGTTFQVNQLTIVQCRVQTTCSPLMRTAGSGADNCSTTVNEANSRWAKFYGKAATCTLPLRHPHVSL